MKKVVEFDSKTFPCPLYEGQAIRRQQCVDQCGVVQKNREVCTAQRCASPWRLCLACVSQGYKKEDAVAVDHASGLCNFHKRCGEGANRSSALPSSGPTDEKGKFRRHVRMGSQILVLDVKKIRPMPDQPREFFDPEGMQALVASIQLIGQRKPGEVRRVTGDRKHEFELIDGQRRWHACEMLGVPFKAYEVMPEDREEQFELSVAANFAHADHTPMEIVGAISRLLGKRKRTVAEVAAIMTTTPARIYQYMKLLRLDPGVQAMLDPRLPDERRLGIAIAQALSDLPPAVQVGEAKKILEKGLTLAEARHAIRRAAHSTGTRIGGRRGRRPSDLYDLIFAFLVRTQKATRLHLDTSSAEVDRMFEHRDLKARRALLKQLDETARILTDLGKMLMSPGRITA